jgi:geranylgeranyl pyrophosphate synthase
VKTDISNKLKEHINSLYGESPLLSMVDYALFPTGKLFRAKLCHYYAQDLNYNHQKNIEIIASAIELHHAYTLIHDDLPSMDNDDYRRGKESLHKKYGVANAILIGDALLASSYSLFSKLDCDKQQLSKILENFHEKTGLNGLILGQQLDLKGSSQKIEDIMIIHELKTSRLIESTFSLVNILDNQDENINNDMAKSIGLIFQLTDDLLEFEKKLSEHEYEINPFLKSANESLNILNQKLEVYKSFNHLSNTSSFVETFLTNRISKINTFWNQIVEKTGLNKKINW